MNPLNKKINKIDKARRLNNSFPRLHSVYKDLKYWEWMYLEDENNRLVWTAVLNSDSALFYHYDVSKTLNIPFKQGGNRHGKKR